MKRMFGRKNVAVAADKSRFLDPALFPTTRWSRVRAAGESVAEGRDAFAEPACESNANRAYEESWAQEVMHRALMRLREKFTVENRAELFDALAGFLDVTGSSPALEEAADDLNLSAGALRTAVSRLRKQFGEQLRLEIARTVSAPHEIEEEFRHLQTVLTIN